MASLFLWDAPILSAGQPADIQAVLFDKDGTMSRSEPQLVALASRRILHCLTLAGESLSDGPGHLEGLLHRAYGLHPEDESLDPSGITAVAARDHNLISTAVALTLVGHGWPEALELAHETFHLADLDCPPGSPGAETTDGLRPLLDSLRDSSVQCAVISNDDAAGIHDFLERHGLLGHIGAVWSADHQPRKPDPRAIHRLCDLLGVSPEQCAMIGDANSDLRMAEAAGVAIVLGYGGGWQRPVNLDPVFPLLAHWSEISVGATGRLLPDPGVSMETRTTDSET